MTDSNVIIPVPMKSQNDAHLDNSKPLTVWDLVEINFSNFSDAKKKTVFTENIKNICQIKCITDCDKNTYTIENPNRKNYIELTSAYSVFMAPKDIIIPDHYTCSFYYRNILSILIKKSDLSDDMESDDMKKSPLSDDEPESDDMKKSHLSDDDLLNFKTEAENFQKTLRIDGKGFYTNAPYSWGIMCDFWGIYGDATKRLRGHMMSKRERKRFFKMNYPEKIEFAKPLLINRDEQECSIM